MVTSQTWHIEFVAAVLYYILVMSENFRIGLKDVKHVRNGLRSVRSVILQKRLNLNKIFFKKISCLFDQSMNHKCSLIWQRVELQSHQMNDFEMANFK